MRQEAIELIVTLKGHTLPKGAKNAYNRLCKAIEQAEKQEQTRSQKLRDAGFTRRPKGWERDAEQAEKQEPVAWWDGKESVVFTHDEIHTPNWTDYWTKPLYTTPQPQREQVVYQLSPTDIYDFAGWLTTRKGLMQVGGAYEAGPMAEAVGEYLKTFPERFATAQREWVGLTEEEITALKRNGERYISSQEFARAIEAKLKEKNT